MNDKQYAMENLKGLVKKGDTVYTVLRHVSSSGMSRSIDVFVIKNNQPRRITWAVGEVLGYKQDRNHEGLKVGGAGMDMGFHVVYSLGRVMFPKGFKIGKNNHARNGDTSGYDKDGGYALNHESL